MSAKIKLIKDFQLVSHHGSRPFIADARYRADGVKKPVLIFIHGFKGFKDWGHFNLIADHLAERGFVLVKLNLSHNGTTPEHPVDFVDLEAFSQNNFSIELDDIGVLIDLLHTTGSPIPRDEIDLGQLFLIGHSRGGGLALLKAAEDERIKKVAAWAPIHDLTERWPAEVLQKWKEDGVYHIYNGRTKQDMPLRYQLVEDVYAHRQRLDIPKAVKTLEIPLLLVHGTADETLSYQKTEWLSGLGRYITLVIVENANHVFGGKHPFMEEALPAHSQMILDKTITFFKSE